MESQPFDAVGGWPGVLGSLIAGHDLDASLAGAAMGQILEGNATPAQIAGFVIALRMKGESVSELSGMLDAMLAAGEPVVLPEGLDAVDIVGTGGDRSHSINVSTLSMLVVAGAGVPVCKHGNRAASSSCGAADLLAELGVRIELDPASVAACVAETGVGFCFAPRFHPALRHAGPTRRELGVPTAFNILGPLANPARVRRFALGVADARMAPKMLGVLQSEGAVRALVVHGDDGLDELTTTTTSNVWELRDGSVTHWILDPRDLGVARATAPDLRGGDPALNARFARAVLAGDRGPHRDIVVLNAAAGLLVAGRVDDLVEGVQLAGDTIDAGSAAATLDRLVERSTRG
ncbi:MAG: anthranilate phosphoribosyltransferase [Acidimicrobiales bacterium]